MFATIGTAGAYVLASPLLMSDNPDIAGQTQVSTPESSVVLGAPASSSAAPTTAAPKPAPTDTKPEPATTTPIPAQEVQPVTVAKAMELYLNPSHNPALRQADEWRNSRSSDAARMDVIASSPTAEWFGDWTAPIGSAVHSYVSAAQRAGRLPVLVAYNIPNRHCHGGGSTSVQAYKAWVDGFAAGLAGRPSIVVVEPDALGLVTCLSPSMQNERYDMIAYAAKSFTAAGSSVYIDASHWVDQTEMASRLQKGGIANAVGFSINVSSFNSTDSMKVYSSILSSKLGSKHYVVDTSRNGSGYSGEWCNPAGRSIGEKPRLVSEGSLDAYLWIKYPGESDGTCNGGPGAGQWWPEYALDLVVRAGF